MRFPRRAAPAALSPRRGDLVTGAVLLLLLLLAAPAARGEEFRVAIDGVAADSGFVTIDFTLNDPLPEADELGPKNSPPAALAYTVELWRDRSGWFDGLVSSRTYGYRLDYDHLRNLYRIVPPGGGVVETGRRADVAALICRQIRVPVNRIDVLDPGKKYYVTVTARLSPIDINKLGEAEGWLSGEFQTGTRRNGVLGVPKVVVGILADVAGFGDRSTVERSSRYRALDAPPWLKRIEE